MSEFATIVGIVGSLLAIVNTIYQIRKSSRDIEKMDRELGRNKEARRGQIQVRWWAIALVLIVLIWSILAAGGAFNESSGERDNKLKDSLGIRHQP
ncbi:hypothetical protein BTHE68_71930 (plasmid) [Burkholderia sp. THE68]|uniref:hypothetical protein n=1 Tax=Burkholderia sp. THE68 TaxID=758782 RepID=UPI0013199734|nr:hypothetical protein [Burkholderia sp. THE68]BBU33459.1 hypothetical protein BTHE68_71930 [Burkholderia sp. THE68]